MKNQLKVFEKVTRETLVLHYGNNGEWWFMDEKGIFVGGYFSSYVMAHQWANNQGFSMSTPAQAEQQSIRLPERKRTDHLPKEYKTMTVVRAGIEAYNRALDDVAALNAASQPVEQWQVRYLPGQKVEERWWQDSTAERASWCAEANAEQMAKGLPDVWEIRKFYAAPMAQTAPQPEQSGLVERLKFVVADLKAGFVACRSCGDQEDTATLDCVPELEAIAAALSTQEK